MKIFTDVDEDSCSQPVELEVLDEDGVDVDDADLSLDAVAGADQGADVDDALGVDHPVAVARGAHGGVVVVVIVVVSEARLLRGGLEGGGQEDHGQEGLQNSEKIYNHFAFCYRITTYLGDGMGEHFEM